MDLPAGAYGVLPTVAAPFLFGGRRAAPTASAPALGDHTEEVLRQAGLSKAEIRELIDEKTPTQRSARRR